MMSAPYQITSEDIRRKRARLAEIEKEAAEIRRWLDSVRSIFGDEPFDEAGAAEHAPPAKTSAETNMTAAVLTALATAPRGLTSGELRRKISAHPVIEERLKKSPKYFYNLVGRLKKKGLAESAGNRLVAVQQNINEKAPPSGGRR